MAMMDGTILQLNFNTNNLPACGESINVSRGKKRSPNGSELRKELKALRDSGKEYVTKRGKGVVVPAKQPPSQVRGCSEEHCSKIGCKTLTLNYIHWLFTEFYKLDYNGQSVFLAGFIRTRQPRRRRRDHSSETSRKLVSFDYNINGNPVCLKTLANAFSISVKRIRVVNEKLKRGELAALQDERGKHFSRSHLIEDVEDQQIVYQPIPEQQQQIVYEPIQFFCPTNTNIEETSPPTKKDLSSGEKKRSVNIDEWKDRKLKALRNAGMEYVNKRGKGVLVPAKQPPYQVRGCVEKNCSKTGCKTLPLNYVHWLFTEFYSLDYNGQSVFLAGFIRLRQPRRRRRDHSTETSPRKLVGFDYNINGKPICLKTLANIFSISVKRIRVVNEKLKRGELALQDERGKHFNRPRALRNKNNSNRPIVKSHEQIECCPDTPYNGILIS